ncbi:MAG: hypothetical protein IPG43_09640 [Proteobacteria bacterium]|nr:hypothetical protein [Pseudomonadota bacterium]
MRLMTFLLALATLLVGCGAPHDTPTVTVSDAWIHPPTVEDPKAVKLPPFLVYRVHADMLKETATELAKEPYIQISPAIASRYTKSDVHVPMEMRPFLIRGLVGGATDITVVQSMQGLWVKAVGSDVAHPVRQPLVVLVDPTPIDIFVTLEPKG